MRLRRCVFIFFSIFLISNLLFAGNTGKIAGVVRDKNNGEPLIGVNVMLQGTTLGATTDLEGEYFILNIPPGKYVVEVQYIGYSNVKIENVRINVDLTTEISFEMQEAVLEMSEDIVVIATRELVTKDLTATTATVGSEEFETLPVTEVSEMLQIQAGYVDGHVRGGRTGEIAYWIDGMPVTDQYDRGTVVEINTDMVEQLQFISGAFNAEYGQAMSGIVNITTKEPRENFGGNFTFYTGDYFSQQTDVYMNVDNFDPSNLYNFEGGIFGTIIPGTLSYYLNARYIYFGGWIYGRRDFNPHNVSYIDSAKNFILHRDESGIGDGEFVPMNDNRKIYLQGKLIYNISPVMKLFYNYVRDDVEFSEYDRNYKYNPDGNLNRFRVGDSHILKFSHTLNPSTYYELGGSFFTKEFKQYVYEDPFDTRYVHPKIRDNQRQYSFLSGGTNNQHFQRKTETALIKLDLTSQINSHHLVKIGGEIRSHDIFFEDINLRPLSDELDAVTGNPFMYQNVPDSLLRIPGIETPYYSKYSRKPREFSIYLQDKMEFDDLIVNLGIRLDHFQPDGVILADPSDPNIFNPIKPENRYNDLNGNGIEDPGETYTPEERAGFWYRDAKNKTQISPRLGVSFPVTETGVVHFSYGHFFQIPNFELLYRNPQFKLGSGTGNVGIIGNSDLDPEFTISGEMGLQQQIGSNVILDIAAYFRDVRDLTGTRAEEIVIFGGSSSYSRLVNSDFGFVKGVILSLKNRYGAGFNYSIDYTFQVANGTASDENAAQLSLAAGNRPEVQLVRLAWDQLHTLNATTSYISETWGASFIGNFGSGLPYTPRTNKDVSALNENSASKPISWNIDMRLHKDFLLFANRFTLFMRVFNLFDHLNQFNVYNDSGKADFTTELARVRSLNPLLPINTLEDWFNNITFYSQPRRIELGFIYNF